MHLSALLPSLQATAVFGNTDLSLVDFDSDSRKIAKGWLFIAIRGTQSDGHDYIHTAIAQGATAIIAEHQPADWDTLAANASAPTLLLVRDSAAALAQIAAAWFRNPSDKLIITGITGTNGKTSTATLLHQLFMDLGYPSGLVSTVVVKIGDNERPATHTTPDPKQLHRIFSDMVAAGCSHCFMEVSSHALVQQRTAGIRFRAAVFTNITHDHLDYHGTFAAYIKAKKMLFDGLGKHTLAFINIDDKNGRVMVQNCAATVKTLSVRTLADYRTKIIENTLEGLCLSIDDEAVWFRLLGGFNAYNLLTVYAVATELLGTQGIAKSEILAAMSNLEGVSGRFQTFRSPSGVTAVIDYAHTPDALEKILKTIGEIRAAHSGSQQPRILTVIGCGGNRDTTKRPIMAQLAASLSDFAILTSDNPRNEEPAAILRDMETGIPTERKRAVLTITDRHEAIAAACRMANPGDIVVIAGKGHENYQEIKGIKYPFNDLEEVQRAFA